MSIKSTAAMLQRSEHIERDLMAARTGQRMTYRAHDKRIDGCANCGTSFVVHIQESGMRFCPENALRDAYGR